jgi:hypothetical protein
VQRIDMVGKEDTIEEVGDIAGTRAITVYELLGRSV